MGGWPREGAGKFFRRTNLKVIASEGSQTRSEAISPGKSEIASSHGLLAMTAIRQFFNSMLRKNLLKVNLTRGGASWLI